MGVPEPGREARDVTLHIDPVAIPPQPRTHGESMTHVMQARADAVGLRGSAQTDLPRQLPMTRRTPSARRHTRQLAM